MITLATDVKEVASASLAWEAACERLRQALHPSPGYPIQSAAEIDEAFANAAERLHILRAMHLAGDV